MDGQETLGLFQGFGVELEYMIVDCETLSMLPVADALIHAVAQEYLSEIEVGELSWSNELVLHLIEIKTTGPAPALEGLSDRFQESVGKINDILKSMGGRLMPTGMHPWMDPDREMHLWPHENSAIYQTFNRLFDCRGHGWSNLQSCHLNLPFKDDLEFAALHAAIRLVLPLIPAIAASSPFVERRFTGVMDNRLEFYRRNAARIPSVSGRVIPERIFSGEEYQEFILRPIYQDLREYDPEGVIQHEWVNARGAIARFDRNTIEIRLLDVQECPAADLAVAKAISAVVRALVSENWSAFVEQKTLGVDSLERIFLAAIKDAELAVIDDEGFLGLFGFPGSAKCTAGELWQHLIEQTVFKEESRESWKSVLLNILRRRTLARRIVNAAGVAPSFQELREVYEELSNCLEEGRLFEG